MGRGDFSSSQQLLKRVARLVHPDRLARVPDGGSARLTNERSLAALHDWVNRCEHHQPASHHRPSEQRTSLTFYTLPPSTNASNASQLHRVDHSLLPPSFANSPASLTRLLCALGDVDALHEQQASYKASEAEDDLQSESSSSLIHHLHLAGERLRKLQARSKGNADDRIRRARTALRFSRKVSIRFGRAPVDAELRAQLCERLVRAVEISLKRSNHVSESMRGCTLELTDCTGLDVNGTMRLRCDDQSPSDDQLESDWASELARANWPESIRREKERERRERMEAEAAVAAGVGMVGADDQVALSWQYEQMLTDMASYAFSIDSRGCTADELSELVLMVLPSTRQQLQGRSDDDGQQAEQCENALEPWSTDGERGVLAVTCTAPLGDIDNFLNKKAAEVARVKRKRKKEEEEVKHVQESAMRSLALRHLHRDANAVSVKAFKRVCMRMMQQRDTLKPLLDGLPVRISDANRIGAYADNNGNLYVDIDESYTM